MWRWWQWPNLLSLDAPVVAVLWQALLAQVTGTMLLPAGRLALGLTVWAIYLADRLLDVRDGQLAPSTARHRFSRRHRGVMLFLLSAVLAADAVTVMSLLREEVTRTGLVAAGGVAAYLLVLHGGRSGRWFPKEPLVAALFMAGVFLVAWTNARGPRTEMAGMSVAFFALVLANLQAVERAEPGRWYAVALGLMALGYAVPGGAWWWAMAASAAALLAVHAVRRNVRGEARRLALDLALLAPVIFLQ